MPRKFSGTLRPQLVCRKLSNNLVEPNVGHTSEQIQKNVKNIRPDYKEIKEQPQELSVPNNSSLILTHFLERGGVLEMQTTEITVPGNVGGKESILIRLLKKYAYKYSHGWLVEHLPDIKDSI